MASKKTKDVVYTLLAMAVVIVIGACALWIWSPWDKGEGYEDLDGNNVQLDDMPDKSQVKEMDIQPLSGDLQIKSVDLGVGLLEMSTYKVKGKSYGMINPPGLTSAYLVRGYGTVDDPESGTTYIALHSVSGGNAPGNKIIDIDNGEIKVSEGDEIKVQDHKFEVTDAYLSMKTDTPNDQDLWKQENGKLVIITCLQRNGGRSIQNAIVIAEPEGGLPDSADDSTGTSDD